MTAAQHIHIHIARAERTQLRPSILASLPTCAQLPARASKCTGMAAHCQRHVSVTRVLEGSNAAVVLRDLVGRWSLAQLPSNSVRRQSSQRAKALHLPYLSPNQRACATSRVHTPPPPCAAPPCRRKGTALADDKRARRFDVVHRPSRP